MQRLNVLAVVVVDGELDRLDPAEVVLVHPVEQARFGLRRGPEKGLQMGEQRSHQIDRGHALRECQLQETLAVRAGDERVQDGAVNGAGFPGWGLAALGPYLVLQLTLLSNPGRVQMMTGLDLPKADAAIVLGLLAGMAGLALPLSRRTRIASAAGAVLGMLSLTPGSFYGSGIWLLVSLQILLSLSLAWALRPVSGVRPGRVHGAFITAALLLFVFIFLFYSRYGWLALWPVMALLAVIPSLAPVASFEGVARSVDRPALLLAAAFIAGAIVLAFLGRPTSAPVDVLTPGELRVLDYNIHQAFNYWSVPDPEATARVIETSNADLVALQEVGRGWNVNGGPDLVAWLRWRLPQYYLVYGPMNGDLWGNVILSRYPVRESGWMRYPVRVSTFQRGLTWAVIPSTAGDLLFVNTHLSAYAGYDEDRVGQAGDLLAFWKGRPRTIIVGDFNAGPDEAPVRRVVAAGLVDVPARHGLGTAFTSPSGAPHERIDYIFASPDVESLSASIPQTTASDHLPVTARLKVR